jgi:hypothetical protein
VTRAGYAATLALSGDRVAVDHLPACPRCGDLCSAGATVCDCGQKLFPKENHDPAPTSQTAAGAGSPMKGV